MSPLLITAVALAGLAVGWGQRAVVLRYAMPAGSAPRAGPDAEDPVPPSSPPALALGLTTAVLLGALAGVVHPGLVLAAACWLAICCVPLAWIDVAVRRLPDALTAPAYAGTVALLLAAAGAGGHWPSLVRAVLGGLTLTGCYLALTVISHSAMGLGDVKLAASLGSLLAWFSWNALLDGAFAGFLLAAVYGIALLIGRRATRRQQIPFGPFMIAGTFAVILLLAGTAAGSL